MSGSCGRLLALVLALLLAGPVAQAQTVEVRSGDHDGFTRLVMDIGADRSWQVVSGEGSPSILFDPPIDRFDTSGVFDRISRARLRDLGTTDGLSLALECDCPIITERFRSRYLVIDILDEAHEGPTTESPVEGTDALDSPGLDEATLARRLAAAEALPNLAQLVLHGSTAPQEVDSTPDPASPLADDAIALEEAASIMAEQLARAAASGLLDAAPGRPLSDADPIRVPQSGDDAQITTDTESAVPISDIPFSLPIRADTAVDVALQRAVGIQLQRPRLACTGQELSVHDWSGGLGVDRGLGALRLALFDDRDQIVPEAVLAIARHYIYYGFGAEARYWLTQIDAPPDALLALAHVVDGNDGDVFPPPQDGAACSPSELLWRYLDSPGRFDLDANQVAEVQRAAAALPVPLRDQLGPDLARHLFASGHPGAAQNIRDMLLRGGRISATVLLHLDLELGLVPAGNDHQTRIALSDALRQDAALPQVAMAHAMRFDRETGVSVAPERIDAAEALLREIGVVPETAALWQEVVLAQLERGDLDRVLELLAGPTPEQEARERVLTTAFRDRLDDQDTAGLLLLSHAHGPTWTATGSEAGRTRVAVMAYLRSQGFPDAADQLRGSQPMLILPARPAAETAPAQAGRTAWLSENWLELAGLTEGAHHDLALRMQSDPQPPTVSSDLDLDAVARRLSDTAALRDTLRDVLADPTPTFRSAGTGSDRP